MGQILSQPITDKITESGENKYVAFGLSNMQGWRVSQEDAHTVIPNLSLSSEEEDKEKSEPINSNSPEKNSTTEGESNFAFFGVFDGHGGDKTAIFTGDNIHKIIKSTKEFKKEDYIKALKETFLACDQEIIKSLPNEDSGCAATTILIINDKSKQISNQIFCANAGDSRTVMSINGSSKALSYDHKPTNEGEKARIVAAGGFVDMGRVNGNLALSRGIGDFDFKKNPDLPAEEQCVTALPDVLNHTIDYNNDEFIILACDGIWDCLTSQQAVECVRRGIYEKKSLTTISCEIMDLCLAPTSDGSGIGCDNMSIIIVALLDYSKNETLEEWYSRIIEKIKKENNDNNNEENIKGISKPYQEIHTEMYGDHQIGKFSQPSTTTSFKNKLSNNFSNDDELNENENENNEDEDLNNKDLDNNAISLQRLLSSNAITNENGVIYLDTSSAQSLLAHFGVNDSTTNQIEEVSENDKSEGEGEEEE
ncbi:PTC2 [Candida jiufengensis]|uniref:PTC2 n=1 Tax=Candida jiufengensis TaxID=497108 RepID=UPI0022242DB5|nr:PTC2 [Candida jiufengensis]KAI5950988.1 PTC2 [Candida jiufengensis]